MTSRKLIAAFLLMLLPYRDFATCIVILINDNIIYVAADTLEVTYKNDIRTGSRQIRKIHLKGDVYFAISGHQDSVLLATAASGIVAGKSPVSVARTFAGGMCAFYNQEMPLLKTAAPEKYKYYLANNLADVSFFGFRKGKPFVLEVSFELKENGGKPETIPIIEDHSDPLPLDPNVVLGFKDHIGANRAKIYPIYFAKVKSDYSNYVALLVKLEADNHRDKVGCPIDKLILKPNSKPVWSKYYCH